MVSGTCISEYQPGKGGGGGGGGEGLHLQPLVQYSPTAYLTFPGASIGS